MTSNIEKWEKQIRVEIRKRIKSGKVVLKEDEEFENTKKKIKEKVPFIKDDGLMKMMAVKYGIKVDEKEDKTPSVVKIQLNINQFDSYTNHDKNEILSTKLKISGVPEPIIKRPQKKDGSGTWVIAEVQAFDETGNTKVSVFHNDKFKDFFNAINKKKIVGKTVMFEGIKIKPDSYSVNDHALSVESYGKITILDDDDENNIKKKAPKLEYKKVKDVKDGDYVQMVLKLIEKKHSSDFNKNDGSEGHITKFSAIDTESQFINVNLWFNPSELDLKNGTIVTVIGNVDESEWQGNIYKNISVNGKDNIKVNPKINVEFKERESVSKGFINARVGEIIHTTASIRRIFAIEPYYNACPTLKTDGNYCNKKVTLDEESGKWSCPKHALTKVEAKKINLTGKIKGIMTNNGVALGFSITDFPTTEENVTPNIKKITGYNIQKFVKEYKELGTEDFFNMINELVQDQVFKIKAKVERDNYNGNYSLKILDINPVDFNEEIARMKEEIKAMI